MKDILLEYIELRREAKLKKVWFIKQAQVLLYHKSINYTL